MYFARIFGHSYRIHTYFTRMFAQGVGLRDALERAQDKPNQAWAVKAQKMAPETDSRTLNRGFQRPRDFSDLGDDS